MATSSRIMLNTTTEDAIVPFAQCYTNLSMCTSQEGSIGDVSGACCCLGDRAQGLHGFGMNIAIGLDCKGFEGETLDSV